MLDVIRFYRVSDEYGVFSNFASFPIEIEGRTWPTTEHYFQAMKFDDLQHQDAIRNTASPMIAAGMGRDRHRPLRPDWETAKVDIMRRAVLAKFTQHKKLSDVLLATGNAEIVEHTKNNSYWGDGGDGSGQNMLGQILMHVRDQLRAARLDCSDPLCQAVKSLLQTREDGPVASQEDVQQQAVRIIQSRRDE